MTTRAIEARSEPVAASSPTDEVEGRVVVDPLIRVAIVANVIALPILVPRGPGNSVPADIPALAVILIGAATLWGARASVRLPLGLSYLLILIGGLLGSAQSIAPDVALTALLVDLYVFVWFVIFVNVLIDAGPVLMRSVGVAAVCTGVGVGVLGVAGFVLGNDHVPTILGYDFVDRFERFSGTFRDPNMAGSYLVVSLFVLWASPWPRRSWTKPALAAPILLAIYATRSNTALFALAAGVAIVVIVAFIRSRRWAVGVTLGVLAAAFALFAIAPTTVIEAPAEAARGLGDTETFSGSLGRFDSSLGGRINRVQETLRLFGPDLVTGIGPSTTNETLFALDAPILGELHNDYVAGLIERGVIGLVGVIAVMATAMWTSIAAARRDRTEIWGWWAPALTGGVASMAVSGLSLEVLHFRHVWFLFAITFAVAVRAAVAATSDRDG